MKYDFTTIYDRHGKDALAVDNMGDGQAPDLPKEGRCCLSRVCVTF